MDTEHINWNTLVNYVTGQCSIEEENIIHEWIQKNPKNEEFILFLKKIWGSSAELKHNWDVDSAWSRFNKEYHLSFLDGDSTDVQKQRKINSIPIRQKPKNYGWYSRSAVAASIAIIFAVLYGLNFLNSEERNIEGQEPLFREIVTDYGQRTHLNLNDGSSVILNAGSKLTIPETFNSFGQREVYLSGEAWFEVTHDPELSFTVYTENAMTKVLGTKFQVTSYPEDSHVQVVVSDGKVALQGPDSSGETAKIITKNQIGRLSDDGLITVSTTTNLTPYLGWTKGELVFLQDPFENVITRLERWYNIDIRIHPDLFEVNQKQLTASFSENQPVHEVLEAISLALDLRYKKDEGTSAYIFFNNSHNNQY